MVSRSTSRLRLEDATMLVIHVDIWPVHSQVSRLYLLYNKLAPCRLWLWGQVWFGVAGVEKDKMNSDQRKGFQTLTFPPRKQVQGENLNARSLIQCPTSSIPKRKRGLQTIAWGDEKPSLSAHIRRSSSWIWGKSKKNNKHQIGGERHEAKSDERTPGKSKWLLAIPEERLKDGEMAGFWKSTYILHSHCLGDARE